MSIEAAVAVALRERERRENLDVAQQRLSELYDLAKQGNPEPLINAMWPEAILDTFQIDLIRNVLSDTGVREVFVKGNTGCGKGASAAIAIVLYFMIWADAKVVITSVGYHHAVTTLLSEVKVWLSRMRIPPNVTVNTDSIFESTSHFIMVVNPSHDEGFSGKHSAHTLFVFDEASRIPPGRFKMARTQATMFLCLSNPRHRFGEFRLAFPKVQPDVTQTILTDIGYRRLITIGGLDCLNVREKRLDKPIAPPGGITIDGRKFEHGELIPPDLRQFVKPIIPGQTCYDTYLGLRSVPDTRWADCMADAKFPVEDTEKQVLSTSWIERCVARYRIWDRCQKQSAFIRRLSRVVAFGLDVAASDDGDETVLSAGCRFGVVKQHAMRERDTMKTSQWVIDLAQEQYQIDLTAGIVPVAVDIDGLGKGVGDRLAQMGVRVIEIRGNGQMEDGRSYLNKRAENWGQLRNRINPLDGGRRQFILPDDQALLEELAAPERVYPANDSLRWGVTPKVMHGENRGNVQSLKDILGRSPDRADSVIYCYQAIRVAMTWTGTPTVDRSLVIDLDALLGRVANPSRGVIEESRAGFVHRFDDEEDF